MTDPRAAAEAAFAELIADLEVELGIADNELQIVADAWTLVLEGAPVTGALIAVDDEEPAPGEILDEVLEESHLAAMQAMDGELQGAVSAALAASPDPLARELARRIA